MRSANNPVIALICAALLLLTPLSCRQNPAATSSLTQQPSTSTPDPELTLTATEAAPGTDTLSPVPHPLAPRDLPDLTPPQGGWIAISTPELGLALTSSDASRYASLREDRVESFVWSPDGRWLALLDHRGQLAIVSIEQSRLIPLASTTNEVAVYSSPCSWSRDSRYLAYLHCTGEAGDDLCQSPIALRLFEVSSGQTTTVTTYEGIESPGLLPGPFPAPLLAVSMGRPYGESGPVDVWNAQTRRKVTSLGVDGRDCFWLPGGRGIIFPQREPGKKPVWLPVQGTPYYPVSVAVWTEGADGPAVVLAATDREVYRPLHWLPDGRLEILVMRWDEDRYESNARPEHEEYRYFSVSAEGQFQATDASYLPWWAGGQLEARLLRSGFPQLAGTLYGWQVAPDGETVVLDWRWQEDEQVRHALYVWRGQGEPLPLGPGANPQWQPSVPSDREQSLVPPSVEPGLRATACRLVDAGQISGQILHAAAPAPPAWPRPF